MAPITDVHHVMNDNGDTLIQVTVGSEVVREAPYDGLTCLGDAGLIVAKLNLLLKHINGIEDDE